VETFPKPISWLGMEKQDRTQQKHAFTNQNKVLKHKINTTRMWANAQPDGRPAEHRGRPLFNAPKFG